MFELHYQLGDKRRQTYRCSTDHCRVGRGKGNDLIVGSRQLARQHACFSLEAEGLFIDDQDGSRGCWVNGQRVRRYGPISELDEIALGNLRIQVGMVTQPGMTDHPASGSSAHVGEVRDFTGANPGGLAPPVEARQPQPDERKRAGRPECAESGRALRADSSSRAEPGCPGDASDSTRVESRHTMAQGSSSHSASGQPAQHPDSTRVESDDIGEDQVRSPFDPPGESALNTWSRIVHERLLSQMDLRRKDVNGMSDSQLREESSILISQIVEQLVDDLPVDLNVAILVERVLDEAIGLGPLEQFLNDDTVTEIMVNNHRDIFLERNGRIERSAQQFSSDRTIYAVIERIITPLGRRIDESSPIVDARLKDGSRVNAVIPPLALKGPCLTIRKFPKHRLNFADLVVAGSVNQSIVDFLQVCVHHRKNIVVAGGTGSGKTTLLNVLSNFIPDTDRIVTIEDAAELRLVQPNLVSLESRPANLEGRGAIPMRDLVRNALRMRPDRIVIGECRGGEAIDMLQAMNTGHDGSLTTVHANNPRDVISRLEVLVLMAGMDLPVAAIREQIASAVDLVIQQTRFPCGARKITRVTEVAGIESGTVQLQDIFVFRQDGFDKDGRVSGDFRATGSIPAFYETLSGIGHQLELDCFEHRA